MRRKVQTTKRHIENIYSAYVALRMNITAEWCVKRMVEKVMIYFQLSRCNDQCDLFDAEACAVGDDPSGPPATEAKWRRGRESCFAN